MGGSLAVVGSGIRLGAHLTQEARGRLELADSVYYLLAEEAPTRWIHRLNPAARSLRPVYRPGREREEIYEEIVETALGDVRQGRDVCMVTYGHPSVFDDASHESVRRARTEGFPARLYPAISALDCLFVDLEVDPGSDGMQLYDATDFLIRHRTPDPAVPLVLWQITVIGHTRATGTVDRERLRTLAERLEETYGSDHEVVVYEASPFPVGEPLIERVSLAALPQARVTGLATLYVPPASSAPADPEMVELLSSDHG